MSSLSTTAAIATTERAGIVAVMSAGEDSVLMQRYARGDLAAFTQLYERHKAALYRYLLRNVVTSQRTCSRKCGAA